MLLLVLATPIPARHGAPTPLNEQADIRFAAVPLDRSARDRRRIGDLEYVGGWSLSSSNAHFGGLSAMHVENGRVIALSDGGLVVRFPLPRGRSGKVRASLSPLADGPGSATRKESRDTEALAVAGGIAWIAFERRNAVWRYRIADWRSDANAKPAGIKTWPKNRGAEGLVRLRDGRFLIFSEAAGLRNGLRQVILFDSDPSVSGATFRTLGYRVPEGYYATDAAELPDGRLLILNRALTLGGVSATLVIAALPASGGILEGREIATFKAPVTVDNMEALSVTREGGRTMLWLASDDNFSPPLQRTLLMKFALLD